MRAYTVHAPPGDAPPERYAFVKDGIAWPALFVPILWILWHRLWLTLVWYIVAMLVLAWVGRLVSEDAAAVLSVLAAILFALEANNIRRLSLTAKGWRDIGASFGANLDEAEIRFFGAPSTQSATALRDQRDNPAEPDMFDDQRPILGLFPEPEPYAAR